jgi:drug/metabolite transporter (DMT)-like permease
MTRDYFNQRARGQGAIFLCAVLWSTSGLFIKLLDWHPVIIAGGRSFIAALFLLAMRLILPRRKGVKNNPLLTLAGGLGYGLTMILFVIANKLTASANAILLQYSAPVWAALLGWALAGEKPRGEHWGALIMVLAGLLLFFREGMSGGSLTGDLIALLSGITFGANSVFMRMQKDGDPADAMLLAHIITAAFGVSFIPQYPPVLTGNSIMAILFMGLFQIGLASFLFAYGIRRISAIQAMLTATIEPILNPVWVLLITGERPSLSAVLGGGIIVAAVIISSVIGKRRETGAGTA